MGGDKWLIPTAFTLIAIICRVKYVDINKRNEWIYYIRTCLPEIEKELFPKEH